MHLRNKGYKNIYQLEGGILSYLNYKNKSKVSKSTWKGDCFVFDDRVTVNRKLQKGKYFQCYGCRGAITKKETESKLYKKGVHCPKCYYVRTDKQKQRSEMRQKQIQLIETEKNKINDLLEEIRTHSSILLGGNKKGLVQKDDSRFGIKESNEGERYIGESKNGVEEGFGRFYNKEGQLIHEGRWKKGVPLR